MLALTKNVLGPWEQVKGSVLADLTTIETYLRHLDPIPESLSIRSGTITSSPTPGINVDDVDVFTITSQVEPIISFTMNLQGSPVEGQFLTIRILDNGTPQPITWGPSFASARAPLPTTTVASQYLYVSLIYNAVSSTWDCLAAFSGTVSVAAAGALSGDGTPTTPLSVKVDGTTIHVNGGDQLALVTPLSPSSYRNTFISTATGNIDDLNFNNAPVILMNNATTATIRGLVAGVDGQEVEIISKGAGEVDTAHQNVGSAAANRLINSVTSGVTPAAPGVGAFTYIYDATAARWRLKAHNQGAFITPTFSAARFTASTGTWTVAAGNVLQESIFIRGNKLTLILTIGSSSNSAATGHLHYALPNSYTFTENLSLPIIFSNSSALFAGGIVDAITANSPNLLFWTTGKSAAWPISTGSVAVSTCLEINLN